MWERDGNNRIEQAPGRGERVMDGVPHPHPDVGRWLLRYDLVELAPTSF